MQRKAVYAILGCMILCGPGLDLFDFLHDIPRPLWDDISFICKNVQILGVSIIGCMFISYSRIIPKTTLFFIATWRALVILINSLGINPAMSPSIVIALNLFYGIWLYRIICVKPFVSEKSPGPYAYYWLRKIHSPWGLFQAVFLPWHHPLYETRVMVQGDTVWLVYHGIFIRREISRTDLLMRKGTKISLRRFLSSAEIEHLDSLVGKKAIPGVRDCRELVV